MLDIDDVINLFRDLIDKVNAGATIDVRDLYDAIDMLEKIKKVIY